MIYFGLSGYMVFYILPRVLGVFSCLNKIEEPDSPFPSQKVVSVWLLKLFGLGISRADGGVGLP